MCGGCVDHGRIISSKCNQHGINEKGYDMDRRGVELRNVCEKKPFILDLVPVQLSPFTPFATMLLEGCPPCELICTDRQRYQCLHLTIFLYRIHPFSLETDSTSKSNSHPGAEKLLMMHMLRGVDVLHSIDHIFQTTHPYRGSLAIDCHSASDIVLATTQLAPKTFSHVQYMYSPFDSTSTMPHLSNRSNVGRRNGFAACICFVLFAASCISIPPLIPQVAIHEPLQLGSRCLHHHHHQPPEQTFHPPRPQHGPLQINADLPSAA